MSILSSSKSYLGIDVGSSSIKVIELTKIGNEVKLTNYAFSEESSIDRGTLNNDIDYLAHLLDKTLKEAGIKKTSAVSSLPTFSVFSSILNLTEVNDKDINSAVQWEAKKVIPLPLDDMILDWRKIHKSKEDEKKDDSNMKVLLTGAPKTLVNKYVEIFRKCNLNLLSLETETFSLIRSLLGNDKSVVMVVEIGASTTDVTVIDNLIPVFSRSKDVGGISITKAISKQLNIGLERAEQFKYDLGVGTGSKEEGVPDTIKETIKPVIDEIIHAKRFYSFKKIEKIILSGGSVLLPNLVDYMAQESDMNVIIGNPWPRVSYPEDLKFVVEEIGPRLSVAVGLAMRDIY